MFENGVILVNEKLEINVFYIYVVGDCVMSYYCVLKKDVYIVFGIIVNK